MSDKPFDTRPAGESTNGLHDLCKWLGKLVPLDAMVEVGVYEGKGSLIFAQYFNCVIAVDPWRTGFDPAGADTASVINGAPVLKKCIENTDEHSNIHVVRFESHEFASFISNQSLNFVYIDADHSYEGVHRDIQVWLPKIKPGCAIGGHDYRPNFKGVTRAVNETFGKVESFQDGSWAVLV